MTIKPFNDFMQAVERKQEWTRTLNHEELMALSPRDHEAYLAWQHSLPPTEYKPVEKLPASDVATLHFDYWGDDTQRDYNFVDSRTTAEHGE